MVPFGVFMFLVGVYELAGAVIALVPIAILIVWIPFELMREELERRKPPAQQYPLAKFLLKEGELVLVAGGSICSSTYHPPQRGQPGHPDYVPPPDAEESTEKEAPLPEKEQDVEYDEDGIPFL